MTLETANGLTLWGFCSAYGSVMGSLMGLNFPAAFHRPVFYTLLAVGIIGLVVMLVGRLANVKETRFGALGGSVPGDVDRR